MTTKNLSGFITDLPQAKANTYVNSGFRIIKEKSYNQKANIPIISQNDDNYLIVKVENTNEGIEIGLAAIRKYAQDNNFKIGNDLWQFNIGLSIEKLGLTKSGWKIMKFIKRYWGWILGIALFFVLLFPSLSWTRNNVRVLEKQHNSQLSSLIRIRSYAEGEDIFSARSS